MVVKPKILLSLATVATLTLTAAIPAAASTYVESFPRPLRKQAVVRVQDIAARETNKGDLVAIGWREGAKPGNLFITFSRNGGTSFLRPNGNLRKYPVLGDGRLGMSVAVCGGRIWMGSSFHNPSDRAGDSDVLLTTRTVGGGAAQRFMTKTKNDRRVRGVDVTCLNNGLVAVAWLEESGGSTKARVLIRSTESLNQVPAYQKLRTLETGAQFKDGISVAGTPDAIHVAWIKSKRRHVRLARIPVNAGTPALGERTIRSVVFKDAQDPRLAAHQADVALAYSDDGKVKIKLSADTGETWGGSKQLIWGGSVASPSVVDSIDLNSGRIVLDVTAKKPKGSVPMRIESEDLGLTWSKRTFGHKGPRVGAFLKKEGEPPLLREAWHNNGSVDTLRAQYEIP